MSWSANGDGSRTGKRYPCLASAAVRRAGAVLSSDLSGEGLSREDRSELLRRSSQALAEMGRGRPLVVFVDDAHLLDGGSAMPVHQLALTGTATVLVTVQSGQTAPDPVVALWRDALAERIDVGALPDAAIEELLVTVLGGPVDTASLR